MCLECRVFRRIPLLAAWEACKATKRPAAGIERENLPFDDSGLSAEGHSFLWPRYGVGVGGGGGVELYERTCTNNDGEHDATAKTIGIDQTDRQHSW